MCVLKLYCIACRGAPPLPQCTRAKFATCAAVNPCMCLLARKYYLQVRVDSVHPCMMLRRQQQRSACGMFNQRCCCDILLACCCSSQAQYPLRDPDQTDTEISHANCISVLLLQGCCCCWWQLTLQRHRNRLVRTQLLTHVTVRSAKKSVPACHVAPWEFQTATVCALCSIRLAALSRASSVVGPLDGMFHMSLLSSQVFGFHAMQEQQGQQREQQHQQREERCSQWC